MSSFMLRVALALLLAFVAACSSSEPSGGGGGLAGDEGGTAPAADAGTGGFLGSCDTRTVAGPTLGQCRDWTGKSNVDVSVSCNGLSGTFSASAPCSTDGRVGTCTIGPTLGAYAVYGYYAPKYAPADAQSHCTDLAGTFAAGDGG